MLATKRYTPPVPGMQGTLCTVGSRVSSFRVFLSIILRALCVVEMSIVPVDKQGTKDDCLSDDFGVRDSIHESHEFRDVGASSDLVSVGVVGVVVKWS